MKHALNTTDSRSISALRETYADFAPAPVNRARHDGWTPEKQKQFVVALAVMGSVGKALKAVSMGRVSAYALRKRPGAEGFAKAWDSALLHGQYEQYSYALERALNGVTTIRIKRGGAIEVDAIPDISLINAALRDEPLGRRVG